MLMFTTPSAMVVLFSVVCVCLSVNMITPEQFCSKNTYNKIHYYLPATSSSYLTSILAVRKKCYSYFYSCVCFYGSYHGEKLQAFSGVPTAKKPKTRRAPGEVFISTVYDDPETTDPAEPLLRRSEPTQLKYRPSSTKRFHRENTKH